MKRTKKPGDVQEYKLTCYVNQDGITVIRCPKCKTIERIDTNKKEHAVRHFRAKCRCGAAISGLNEFRCYNRKKVRLNGFYKNHKTGSEGLIIVGTISLMGLDFSCLEKHDLQMGDRLDITFNLDDRKASKVTLPVEVLHINNEFVGVKRCAHKKMQSELRSYLT